MKEREEVDRRGPLLTFANLGGLVFVMMAPDRLAILVCTLVLTILPTRRGEHKCPQAWVYLQHGIQFAMIILSSWKLVQTM